MASSFETSVHIHPSKWRHLPEDNNSVGAAFRYDSDSERAFSLEYSAFVCPSSRASVESDNFKLLAQ